jgi:hypothetical protein
MKRAAYEELTTTLAWAMVGMAAADADVPALPTRFC